MQDRNKKTAIGLDIGTTTICGVLTDICTGEMIKKITLANDTFIEGKEDFEKLQDAAKIEEKCLGIIEELSNGADDLACIGVTGQMHGIVYVDREGNGVSPVIIWQDGRGNCPYPGQPDKSYAEVLSQRSGYRLATGFGVVTHYYNWVNHLIPEMAVTFCTIPDYIAMGLAGLRKPVLHGSMAASLGLFSMEQGMFDHEAIENLGMDYSFFPEVLKEEASIGMWKGMAKIGPAFGDNQASFLGSVDGKSNVLVNVGTGSQVSILGEDVLGMRGRGTAALETIEQRPVISGKIDEGAMALGTKPLQTERKVFDNLECRPFMEGRYLYVGSSLCGGYAYALLKGLFEEVLEMCGKEPSPDLYEAMNTWGKKSREQGVSLTVDTRFRGSRKEPELRGKIENISPDNLKAGALICGVLEGICQELWELYREYETHVPESGRNKGGNGIEGQQGFFITGSGNGLRNNPLLREIICEKFDAKMKIPLYEEEAAYGSALFSLYTSGYYASLKDLQGMVR